MTPSERHTFLRIIGTLLVSDLTLQDAEVRYQDDLYDRLGVTEDERKEIQHSINVDDDVQKLAASLSPEARVDLLEELYRAAWADGILMASEAAIIVAVEDLLKTM